MYTETRDINNDSFIETEILQTKYKVYKQILLYNSIYNYPLHDLCCGTIKFTTLDKEIMIFRFIITRKHVTISVFVQ